MDGFKSKLNHSIQFRLSFWIALVICLMAVVSVMISYFNALGEAKEIQDEGLKQISLLVKQDQIELPLNKTSGKASKIIIQPIPNTKQKGASTPTGYLPLPDNLPDGFHTLTIGKLSYRVFKLTLPNQNSIAISQPTVLRDEAAVTAAISAALPMLLLLPILIAAAYFLVRNAFKPIVLLSDEIHQRTAQDLMPFTNVAVPIEIRPLIAAINQLFHKVSLSVASQKRFIAYAAHELRSPLTALSLQSERLAATKMSDAAHERLFSLRKGIERISMLLEQLLSFAKSQKVIQHEESYISVHHTFVNILEDLMPLAEAKNINIGIQSKQDVTLKINESDLVSIIKNLVDNAIRYTPEGGQIDLSVMSVADNVILEIEDSGYGIPEKERERVFDAFYRILGSESQGSGLGLSIIENILNRIGGSIMLLDSDHFPSGLKVRVIFNIRLS